MPYTRQDLCEEVLDSLGMVGAGDTASAGDIDKINSRLDAALRELTKREVIYIQNKGDASNLASGAFPDETLLALADAMTRYFDTKFGAPGQFDAKAMDGESRLRAMNAEMQVDEPIRAVYY